MSNVCIICGSAFSSRLEELSKDLLTQLPNAILIVPTQKYASFWERKILKDLNVDCLTGRYVYDFTNFVRVLLEEENIKCNLIEIWKQELIVKSILLSEEGKSKLTPFQLPFPESLSSHVVEIIRNLKQGGIEPDEFINSIPSAKRKLREEIIYWVYKRYQEIMYQNSWYDVPGMFWMAEEICKNKKPKILENVNVFFLEGFDDFTRSELRLLEVLGGRVGSLRIYLNYDPSPERRDLYRLSCRALEDLRKIFTPEVIILDTNTPQNRIQFVAQNLYWRDHPKPLELSGGEIKIRFFPNRDTEIRETAREIKKLVLEKGVSPFKIALIFRRIEPVQKIIKRVFEEYKIPYTITHRRKFKEATVGRFLWNWYSHLLDDKVFSLLQIFHDSLWSIPIEIKVKVSLILRQFEINLNHSVSVLEERLQKYSLEVGESSDVEEEDSEETIAQGFLSKEEVRTFKDETERWLGWRKDFLSAKSIRKFVEISERFIKEVWKTFIEGETGKKPTEYRENEEGLSTFVEEMKQIPNIFEGSNLEYDSIIETVLDLLQGIVVGTEHPKGVFIGELPDIRNLRFDYVFLCGVERGNIPLHRGINALYSEKELLEICGAYRIPVETLEEHLHRERLLFQKVFESATNGVYLSYALFSEVNEETTPSLLIKDVRELCETLRCDCGFEENLLTSPEFELPCSERELKLISFLTSPVKHIKERYPLEATRAEIYQVRLRNEKGIFFGVLSSGDLLEYVSQQFGERHIYSADQIERYIDCPFMFFVKKVLSLSDWERDTDEPPNVLVGSWAHEVLHHLLRDYSSEVLTNKNIYEVVSRVVNEVVDNDSRSRFYSAGIIQVFKNRLKILIEAMVCDGLLSKSWVPKYFEISFGDTKYDDETYGRLPPFIWDIDGRKVLFSGRIDRVDIAEETGMKIAKIIDYKWRKAPSQLTKRGREFDVDDIVSIQLTLYGLALEKHILSNENVVTSDGCFFIIYPDVSRKSREIKAKWSGCLDSVRKWREMTGRRVLNVIDKIRSGYYPPEPRNESICEHCQWLNACKYKKSLHREDLEGFTGDEPGVE